NPSPYGLVTVPATIEARIITIPSAPTSLLGATSGVPCGPYTGCANGHAHCPGHCFAELPTQMWVVPALASEPCLPHRLLQKPSTVTSSSVKTSATPPLLVPTRAASWSI
ncbi:Os02g0756300, partial [Oryza sativa Japonica Group]